MQSTALLLCSALTLAALAVPAWAQEDTSAGFDATEVAEKLAAMLGDDATDVTKYEESLQRLEDASQAFTPEDKAAIMERLRAEETTIAQAEQDFDRMITDLEETQTLGDPDGEFVAFMNEMQLRARDEANEAERDNDNTSRDAFLAMADSFEAARDRAIEARNEAIPAIDFIKQNKRAYVRQKRLRAFAQIAIIAEQAVEKVETQSQAVRAAASALRQVTEGTPR